MILLHIWFVRQPIKADKPAVVKRNAVPKQKKRAEKPKVVEIIEISSDSDEEHGLVAVQEKNANKKKPISYTSVLTARSKVNDTIYHSVLKKR